ncbi:hypothetical protein TrST_g3032 [Triparma strigata]|uniref:Peptidase M3A/M3B catalytic domain-containing protein n=1 Tax=Triparma strigata TaxID=1606541 RepID=A0A9W6ZN87_9STRA|nr:hypothetical protein TrST_g3032 [Triparma strigata]
MFRSSYGLGRNIQQIVHPSKNNLSSLASPVAPLLNLSGYTTPASFLAQTNVAISQCVSLRSDLLSSVNSFDFDNSNNQTNETYPNLILNLHRLDSISNSICSVIDLAELIRNVHKCPEWREKANESFSVLYGFISELNTDVELYNAVKKIEEHGLHKFDYEESRMIKLLRTEFESDGIHLPDADRSDIVGLKNELMDLESEFQNNIISSRNIYSVPSKSLTALNFDPTVLSQLRSHLTPPPQPSETVLTTDNYFTSSILKYEPSPTLRSECYIQSHTVSSHNLPVLEDLRSLRHEIAGKLGFGSHADRTIADKMAGRRGNVIDFLEEQVLATEEGFKREMEVLAEKKYEREGTRDIMPWDIPYYVNICKEENTVSSMDYSEYLTVSNCLSGMKNVCSKVLGVDMVEEKVERGEGWCDTLIKYNFSSEGNHMGTLYLDLYPREDKYNHAAHFTVRCGCKFLDSSDSLTSQKPVVAIVANFGSSDSVYSNISHNEAETLFHEFGHAMHSIMSRTKFQHMSGTRGPVDFVETPSHIMEYFVRDWRSLREFAVRQDGKVIEEKDVKEAERIKGMFKNLEKRQQTLYSEYDQALFGPNVVDEVDSSVILEGLHGKYSMPFAKGTHWQSTFGHLNTYGAAYYAYPWAQGIAGNVFNEMSKVGLMNRESGAKLGSLLRPGGSKDPFQLVEGALGYEWDGQKG